MVSKKELFLRIFSKTKGLKIFVRQKTENKRDFLFVPFKNILVVDLEIETVKMVSTPTPGPKLSEGP